MQDWILEFKLQVSWCLPRRLWKCCLDDSFDWRARWRTLLQEMPSWMQELFPRSLFLMHGRF